MAVSRLAGESKQALRNDRNEKATRVKEVNVNRLHIYTTAASPLILHFLHGQLSVAPRFPFFSTKCQTKTKKERPKPRTILMTTTRTRTSTTQNSKHKTQNTKLV
jgi:hypothetical protein